MKTRTLAAATLAALLLGLTGPGPTGAQTRAPVPKASPAPAGGAPGTAKPQAARPATTPGAAQKSGPRSNSPIVIDADRMEATKKEGLVIFTGNVVAKQDNSTQAADRMEVYLDDKGGRVLRIISVGNVKIVTEDCRTGTARRAEYYDDEQRLKLIGDAKVWQEENVVSGDEIEMFLAEDRSTVRAGTQGRVKSVFYPKREESKPDETKPATKKDGQGPASCN